MDELHGPGMWMILVCFKNAMTHLTVVCTAYTEESKGVTMTHMKENIETYFWAFLGQIFFFNRASLIFLIKLKLNYFTNVLDMYLYISKNAITHFSVSYTEDNNGVTVNQKKGVLLYH